MNSVRTECHGISRRMVLTGTALALGTAAASQALGQQKLTQADATYQATPKNGQRCGVCFNFQQPSGCKFVQGTISPDGWCQLFAPKT
jgi:hypothetical protein